MIDMTTETPFVKLRTASGAPYVFVAAEHKLVARNIFHRDGIQSTCEVALRDGKTNLPTQYSFTFATDEDAEIAVAALNAAPEPEED